MNQRFRGAHWRCSKLITQQILSKGKVLYPNPSLTNSEISQQLMDQSPQDTGGSSSKVALMVVGTVIGHELVPPPPPPRTTTPTPMNDDDDDNTSRPWWQTVIRTGQAIAWQVWNWSWIILRKAMAAASQNLLAYTRQQPPSEAAGAGRPEEVD